MKVAIVGSGISGLSAAWLLSFKHEVTLFEKESYCGGHAHTIDIAIGGKHIAVDTGFMVFNLKGYPQFAHFLKTLGVQTKESEMSFSVSLDAGAFEYGTNSLFADRANIFRPAFWRFLFEIPRFNKLMKKALESGIEDSATIADFLNSENFSEAFRAQYIYPMASLIWSAPPHVIATFPLKMMATFFNQHNLLSLAPGLRWRSIAGGSCTYVNKIQKDIIARKGNIKTSTAIESISRSDTGARITSSGASETFDAVVIATHADTTLALLEDPSDDERSILGSFRYQYNRVVVHGDPSFMPERASAWSAWNFRNIAQGGSEKISLTYDMNVLQQLMDAPPLFVTVNPSWEPEAGKIYGDFNYAHPIHALDMSAAQKRLPELQGKRSTYFCGSYFGYGFHEDGLVSGMNAASYLGATAPWQTSL
jgi:predicted NAD/FAD-binding protein